MKYCARCGLQLQDDANFCPRCGLPQQPAPPPAAPFPGAAPQASSSQPQPMPAGPVCPPPPPCPGPDRGLYQEPAYKPRSTGLFVWSIILIFLCNPAGTPLGILAAVFAALANSKTDTPEETEKHRTVSRTLCIVATVADVVCILGIISLLIFKAIQYTGGFPTNSVSM